ncbi:hypothetical protein BGX26_006544 [Mortierella sp. AD094]|nr:hypothetical protein BGX26_006544 [Mortierella sp. AD094]
MSSVKDAVATSTPERPIKRSLHFTARHDSRQRSIEQHVYTDHTGHARDGNDSAALHASLNQSRQSWTHTAFNKFIPASENNDRGLQLQLHTSASSGLSLAGVCTVRIGPHMFLDTKFYTVLNPPSPSHTATIDHSQAVDSSGTKQTDEQEQQQQPVVVSASAAGPSPRPRRPQHQVVMEFKENPGAIWLFPEEASLEFTPANDRDSAQITASFCLPVPGKSGSNGHRSEFTHQPTTMIIQHATAALREGLELAVKGPLITYRFTGHKPKPAPSPSRQHNLSTYSEDPSEILGSGKQTANNNNNSNTNNASPTKRKSDVVIESQKSSKPKRPREQDEKAPSSKKATSGSKKSGASGLSSTSAQQKRCGYCDCTTTPMWRRGPNGPSTLCNACGVKWKHGKILQDPNDTHQTQKPGSSMSTSSATGSSSSSAPHRPYNSKVMKEALENGRSRLAEDKKLQKLNSKKSAHGPVHGEYGEKLDSIENSGTRAHGGERMIPVKKRHLAKVSSVSPPGPRMVPIHELGDPTKTPSKFPPMSRKHGYEDAVPAALNGRIKQSRNGFGRHEPPADPMSSSASTTSSQSELNESRLEVSKRVVTSVLKPTPEENLSLYTRNRYTNNTATFPLHFPTISIAFGPNNAYYTYPNCAMVLYENHFQIKLIQDGERTEIDVWKEGIEGTEFKAVDVGDGESMIIMKALLRQYLTRFDKELLNPDRNESLIVFRFRERLDGGGPSVKPLLEHWLATDIPVPPPPSNNST